MKTKTAITKNRGLTLTELLVASILIGIIMIGVASFSVSIGQLQNSTNRSTILAMKTMTVMNRITRDAYSVVGNETDRGVVVGGNGNNKESICFRHDVNLTPEDYIDDTWNCYFADNQGKLWLCDPGLAAPANNWGSCKKGNEEELLSLEDSDIVNVSDNADGQLEYIEIDLHAIFERTGGGPPQPHYLKNPTHHLNTQVRPPGHSS